MKNFWIMYVFNVKTTAKMMRTTLILMLVLSAASLVFFGGNQTEETQTTTTLYIENKTAIPNTLLNEKLNQYAAGQNVYQIENSSDEATEHDVITIEEADGEYTVNFLYRTLNSAQSQVEKALEVILNEASRGWIEEPSHVQIVRTMPNDLGGLTFGYLAMVVIWFVSIVCGGIMGQSTSAEKINKTMDILAYKVSPATVVYAKLLAILSVFVGMGAALAAEVALFHALGIAGDDTILMMLWGHINIDAFTIIVLSIFILLGWIFSLLVFGIAAMFVKTHEQQSTVMTIPSTILMFTMFGTAGLLIGGNEALWHYALYFPLTAPLVAPTILLSGTYHWLEFAGSGLILVATLVIINIIMNKIILPRKIN